MISDSNSNPVGLGNFLVAIALMAVLNSAIFLAFGIILDDNWKLSRFEEWVAIAMLWYLVFHIFRSLVYIFLSFWEFLLRQTISESNVKPYVSVVIPCHNEERVVREAIQSATKLNYPNFEILVVDDGSSDLTLQAALKETASRVRVIHQRNMGKAAALNRGISEASGEYVLCVDADSILDPDVLLKSVPILNENDDVAAVAGSVKVGNATSVLTFFQKLEYIVGLNFIKTSQSLLSIVNIVPGTIGLFRKKVVLELGSFSSNTFAEDCDLTVRMLMAGYQVKYEPEMVAVTEAPENFWSLMIQRYRWSRGTVQALKKNAYWFLHPFRHSRNFMILFYMMIEAVFIPVFNFVFAFVMIEEALIFGSHGLLGPFFLSLTAVDLLLALYNLIFEKGFLRLIFFAALNRITFGLSMEVLRFFSILDEVFLNPMSWGVQMRRGLK